MWTFTHTETTSATAEQLWKHYADPASWPAWDRDIASVTVQGPMAVGTGGTLRPVNGPSSRFVFSEVRPQISFTDVARLPLARMTFGHVIESLPVGTRFTHTVTIAGLLSPLFGLVIGRNVASGLPVAMKTLARLAESSTVDE